MTSRSRSHDPLIGRLADAIPPIKAGWAVYRVINDYSSDGPDPLAATV